MDHYVDIEVRPDPEFGHSQIMNALYAKLHRALVAQEGLHVGISLPDVNAPEVLSLGMRLRLHGTFTALSELLATEWLVGMRDHVTLTLPALVPDHAQHRFVRRVQVKSSPERLRRRFMRRHDLDEQTARQRIPDDLARFTRLPFLLVRSLSTGQIFKLFIEHGPIQSNAVSGNFNTYGLSKDATIPWF